MKDPTPLLQINMEPQKGAQPGVAGSGNEGSVFGSPYNEGYIVYWHLIVAYSWKQVPLLFVPERSLGCTRDPIFWEIHKL